MKTIDEYAAEASRACSRWYGRVATFEDYIARIPVLSCAEWFKAHWAAHPATSPDAKTTIEHKPAGNAIDFLPPA